jgi:FRG domain
MSLNDASLEAWIGTYREVVRTITGLDRDTLLFRGHRRHSWPLLPGLARLRRTEEAQVRFPNEHVREGALFFDFTMRAGELLPDAQNAWETAFAMQHHGLPTRLLDWSDTFSVALYFAIKNCSEDAAVWILDPFALNERMIGKLQIVSPKDLDGSYEDYFINLKMTPTWPVVALFPNRHNPRISRQRSAFTLHADISTPLETLCPNILRKILIPRIAHAAARRFLELSGISEFSLFPDLDGLARDLGDLYL